MIDITNILGAILLKLFECYYFSSTIYLSVSILVFRCHTSIIDRSEPLQNVRFWHQTNDINNIWKSLSFIRMPIFFKGTRYLSSYVPVTFF